MEKSFNLDEKPLCPSCNRQMEHSLKAKDFVVCDFTGKPTGKTSKDSCGHCGAFYTATPTADNTRIIFKKFINKF
jgi:predicted amidophosphoribosyltransferase